MCGSDLALHFFSGNNWGKCEDGGAKVGCGPQEEFRACADIRISRGEMGNTWAKINGQSTNKPNHTISKPKSNVNSWSWTSWQNPEKKSRPVNRKLKPHPGFDKSVDTDRTGYSYSSNNSQSYSYSWASFNRKASPMRSATASVVLLEENAEEYREHQESLIDHIFPGYQDRAKRVAMQIAIYIHSLLF